MMPLWAFIYVWATASTWCVITCSDGWGLLSDDWTCQFICCAFWPLLPFLAAFLYMFNFFSRENGGRR